MMVLDLDLLSYERAKYIVQRSYDQLPPEMKREVTLGCIRTGTYLAEARVVGEDVEFSLGGYPIAVVPRGVLVDPDALLADVSMTWVPDAPDDISGLSEG